MKLVIGHLSGGAPSSVSGSGGMALRVNCRLGESSPTSWLMIATPRSAASRHALPYAAMIDDASWATLPIEHAWGPFFPDVAEKDRRDHFYPPPLSDVFWRDYGEPLSAFLEAATLFSETLQNLDAEVRDDDPEHELQVNHRHGLANRTFFSLLASCHPALSRDARGARTRAFHSKSLLASLAMMAHLDLTSGKRVLLCDEDGRPFVSGAYQARYCSDRCRNRALKRAYRERHRDREAAVGADTDDVDNIQRASA